MNSFTAKGWSRGTRGFARRVGRFAQTREPSDQNKNSKEEKYDQESFKSI